MTLPGIGPFIASEMVAAIGNGAAFARARDFAALAWPSCLRRVFSLGFETGKIAVVIPPEAIADLPVDAGKHFPDPGAVAVVIRPSAQDGVQSCRPHVSPVNRGVFLRSHRKRAESRARGLRYVILVC
jgi:hypothetical protein